MTKGIERKPWDFFHSRLAASPDGSFLISAGWSWQPVDLVRVYDVEAGLADPSLFDESGFNIDAAGDESSATFDCNSRVTVALNGALIDGEETSSSEIRIFDLRRPSEPRIVRGTGRVGTLMAVGRGHILGLYKHPRLIEIRSGKEIQCWPHIYSGEQVSSILVRTPTAPPIALDPQRRRCAVADGTGITVLSE